VIERSERTPLRKAANPLLLGALTGLLTLLCTYIFGTIHRDFYLAIVNLSWWIMCLSVIPSLLLLTILASRLNKNFSYILTSSITSGIVFMIIGWLVLGYKKPIMKLFYNFFPSEKYHSMIGYPSNVYILNGGIFLVVIILSYLIIIQKVR
jgi:hypothetical protein